MTWAEEQLFLLTGIQNRRFMGLWFGVIRWRYGEDTAKRRCVRRFDVHSNICIVTFTNTVVPFNFDAYLSVFTVQRAVT